MPTLRITKDLFDIFHPIGTYYETSNANFNPNTEPNWYGTWVQDTKGQTMVSKSDSGTFKTLGADVGEEKHTLSVSEIPSHGHGVGATGVNDGAGVSQQFGNYPIRIYQDLKGNWGVSGIHVDNNGGGQSHNNIQPSKVCIRWHRTA